MNENTLRPGSAEAIVLGCTCDPGHRDTEAGPVWRCGPGCPPHGLASIPPGKVDAMRDPPDEGAPQLSRGPGIGPWEVNAGTPWTSDDIEDLLGATGEGVEAIAAFLCRPVTEVHAKVKELGLALLS